MDHHFNWEQGRVLQRYQIILVSEGAGVFECESVPGSQPVEPGTVLLLFPGIWHCYFAHLPKPDGSSTGLSAREGCSAPPRAARLIQPKRSVIKVGPAPELSDRFERCHFLARQGALANQDLLSTLGLHILALLGHLGDSVWTTPRRTSRSLSNALIQLIALRCQEPLDLRALATELGVGYSHLRHSFTARIGISPRQHYLNTRLQKAQDLLSSTAKSIKEIAEILGFESPIICRTNLSPAWASPRIICAPRPSAPGKRRPVPADRAAEMH